MTIDGAIKILSTMTKGYDSLGIQDVVDAQKLGVEALKAINLQRQDRKSYSIPLLPGETED